jgi:hypothetical protein
MVAVFVCDAVWLIDCVTVASPPVAVAVPVSDADWLIEFDCVIEGCANACSCGIAPNPIKAIADSTSAAAVANIASLARFRFLSAEFPVNGIFIVSLYAPHY